MIEDDPDLRHQFTALRNEEQTRTPEFVDLLHRENVRPRSKSFSRLIAASALLAVTIASIFWIRPALHALHRDAGKAVVSITEWKSPTAFLLDTPGRDILQTVPRIGVGHEFDFAPRATQKHRHVNTQPLP
jgi:hypothetical protein